MDDERCSRLKKAIGYLVYKELAPFADKDVAEAIGEDSGNLSKYLNGKLKIGKRLVAKFNAAFGGIFNEDWFLAGEGDMLKEQADASESQSETKEGLVPGGVSWEKYEDIRDKYVSSLEENMKLKDRIYELEDIIKESGISSKKGRHAV